ncbi:disease resistance protein Roq1-like [Malus domestica]|uniref:disease resistance protein Roq1-like n=1 Tax=Malus domestica TaxID=3750 RepID=UPI000498D228
MEKSKLSVIIFSATTMPLPIFYHINPSHVRKQQGSYADAFAQHEEHFKDNFQKVHKWRAALTQAANLSGFDNSKRTGREADLVKKIVENIWSKLIQILKYLGAWEALARPPLLMLYITAYLLNLKLLVFFKIVREDSEKYGLDHMQNKLLRKILGDENLNIDTLSIGSELVKKRLLGTKVLIVLDDVNHVSQLELLVGDHVHFGPGSRIIITTRDRRILKKKVDVDKIYKVTRLQHDDALELFHLNAFKNSSTISDYTELSRIVVGYVGGIPLALRVLGSLFLHCESKEDWKMN